MHWELIIDEIHTELCVGIDEAEQHVPQRLLVSARIWADYPALPSSINECADYGMLHDLVTRIWPARPQTQLLETLAIELFSHIFAHSPTIKKASVTLLKPDIFSDITHVGISTQLTREAFNAL